MFKVEHAKKQARLERDSSRLAESAQRDFSNLIEGVYEKFAQRLEIPRAGSNVGISTGFKNKRELKSNVSWIKARMEPVGQKWQVSVTIEPNYSHFPRTGEVTKDGHRYWEILQKAAPVLK